MAVTLFRRLNAVSAWLPVDDFESTLKALELVDRLSLSGEFTTAPRGARPEEDAAPKLSNVKARRQRNIAHRREVEPDVREFTMSPCR